MEDELFAEDLRAAGIDVVAAHGSLCGFLCAGGDADELDDGELEVLLSGPEGSHTRRLLGAVQGALSSLDYTFRPLIGDDDVPLDERVDALSRWCAAFMGGFGLADVPALAHDNSRELLADLLEIGNAAAEADADEQHEAAFEEVYEYVRVAALTLYTEAEEHLRGERL